MTTQPSYDKLLDPISDISASIEALLEGAFGALMGDQRECLKRIYTSGWGLHTLFMDVITSIGLENLAKRDALLIQFEKHLNPVLNNSRNLLDEMDGPLSEEQEVCLEYIHETALLLHRYVEKLWLYSRLHHGKVLPKPQSTLLEQLINREAWLKGKYAVSLDVHLPDAPLALYLDKDLMSIVLRMLIENAIEAMGEDGYLNIRTKVDEGQFFLYIEDTSDGIMPEYRERIFEPFFQINALNTGLGLGLSIAREILHLHRGTIIVNPLYHDGTSIVISLPLN